MTVLCGLEDGVIRTRAAFFQVGRKTFEDLIEKGLVIDPEPEHFSLRITEEGKLARAEAVRQGVMPIDPPSDRIWAERTRSGTSVWDISGKIADPFPTYEEAARFAESLRLERGHRIGAE